MTAGEVAPDLVRLVLGEPADDDWEAFREQMRRAHAVLDVVHDLIESATGSAIAKALGGGG